MDRDIRQIIIIFILHFSKTHVRKITMGQAVRLFVNLKITALETMFVIKPMGEKYALADGMDKIVM